MTNLLILAALIAVGVPGAILFVRYCSMRTSASKEFGRASAAFFDAASKLAREGEVPAEILDTLDVYNETINDPRVARVLLGAVRDFRGYDRQAETYNKIKVEFFHRRPELEPLYNEAVAEWFSAVTAHSPIYGKVLRTVVHDKLDSAPVRRATAFVVKKHPPRLPHSPAMSA